MIGYFPTCEHITFEENLTANKKQLGGHLKTHRNLGTFFSPELRLQVLLTC